MLLQLDHVNVYTHDLAALSAWYQNILGMRAGERPPFKATGIWLYVEDQPCVHMTQVKERRQNNQPGIEHFAFSATNIGEFLDRLDTHHIRYRTAIVPKLGTIQVNFHDPDGNHIHVDFAESERDALHARS